MKPTLTLLFTLLLAPLAALHAAELKPADIFSDHMVLQRDTNVPVWGTTKPGSTVTVTFMKQTKTATADDQGQWMVRLDKMEEVSDPQEMIVKSQQETRVFKDVLVGDVWLGAGQSNMEFGWTFRDELKERRAIQEKAPERAKDPNYYGNNVDAETMKVLRRAITNPLIRVSAKTRDHLNTPNTGWSRVTEENVNTLPALPGCIAVYLQEEIDVPIGIIVRAVSGTAACRWISESAYMSNPLVKQQIGVFESQGGKPGVVGSGNRFGDLYAEYVSPVVPYAIRGFFWDQGEWRTGVRISNELVGRTGQCSLSDWTPMMHALVTEWRRAWGQGDLPWSATDHYPDELEAKLHETGIKAFMIAKTDGLSRALHPLNKWQYAQKHLDNILPTVYGKESPFQKSTGAQEPGHAKPAGGDVVLSKAARADELAKSAHAALKRASKLTSPVNKEAREKEVAAAAAAFREAMTIHPRWAIEGVDEKNPWAVAAARKARADLWSGIGEFEKARAEHHEALAKIGSQLDAKSYIQMLIGDLYKQEQNWAKAEEFYLAAQKTGLYGDRKVLVPRHLEEVRKLMVESGGLKIAGVFGDHMVLQCQAKVPVWGEGVPGGAVTVCFNGQIKTTSVDADRKWIVRLDEMEANHTPQEMTISAANEKVKFRDVLIGEVWLGSGQSNMAGKTVSYAKNDAPLAKMAEQSIPTLRLYRGGKWTSATPEVSRDFSALMFAFGVRLHSELGQPVGMIVAAVGGTPSGDWVTAEMLEADQPYQAAVKRQMERAAGDANFNQAMKKHEEALAAWKKSVEDAEKAGQKVDPTNKPQPPLRPGESRGKIGGLYEKHIHPIVGFGIRGVLWDQGEQGTGIEKIYNDTVTPALIQGWRTDWGQGEFPFLYVQKQSGGGCAWNPEDPVTAQADKFQPLPAKPPHISAGIWKELHIRIGRASNTAMVTCTDLGGGIHPPNKSGYGTRAAQVALGFVYKRPLEYQGPTYASHVVEGSAIRVRFDHVGQGLAAAHSETLQGFMIAGEDKVFHWADAVIDGDSVVLRSPAVSQPASARYAWSEQFPWANLFNKDGLPALTFRTDNW